MQIDFPNVCKNHSFIFFGYLYLNLYLLKIKSLKHSKLSKRGSENRSFSNGYLINLFLNDILLLRLQSSTFSPRLSTINCKISLSLEKRICGP